VLHLPSSFKDNPLQLCHDSKRSV